MSDINLDFTVSTSNIQVTVDTNEITLTPTDIQLNVLAAGLGVPGGSTGQLQYNNGGLLGGIANTSYSGGNLSLGDIANVKISGGSNSFALITDGNGNLSFGSVSNANTANIANTANYAGNVTVNAQPNITSLGTLTGLTVNGTSNLTSVSNVRITGGTNGYFLQTDGTGNLTWTAGTGNVTGNGTVGGSNTQIQFNDAGNFGGAAGFTFNKTTNNMAVPGNVTASYFIGNGSQLTGLSTSSISNGTSNIRVFPSNIEVGIQGFANQIYWVPSNFYFNGAIYSNVLEVANNAIFYTNIFANGNITANGGIFGTIKTANQPNITSLGTLTGLTFAANSQLVMGSNSIIDVTGNIICSNLTGTFTANSNSQPNITSLGTLTGLNVNGATTLTDLDVSGNSNVSGIFRVESTISNVTLLTAQTGTYNFDFLTSNIKYSTANANANITINFRGNANAALAAYVSNGNSITGQYIMTTGATAYTVTGAEVDGSAVTILWANNASNTASNNTTQVFTFNLFRTGTSPTVWKLFGSKVNHN